MDDYLKISSLFGIDQDMIDALSKNHVITMKDLKSLVWIGADKNSWINNLETLTGLSAKKCEEFMIDLEEREAYEKIKSQEYDVFIVAKEKYEQAKITETKEKDNLKLAEKNLSNCESALKKIAAADVALLANYKKDIAAIADSLKNAENAVTTATAVKTNAEKQLATAKANLTALETQKKNAEAALKTAQTAQTNSSNAKTTAYNAITAANTAKDKAQTTFTKANTELNQLITTRTAAQTALNKSKTDLTTAEKSLATTKADIPRFEKELADLKALKKKTDTDNARIKAYPDWIKNAKDLEVKQTAEIATLKNTITTQTKAVTAAETAVNTKAQTVTTYQTDLTSKTKAANDALVAYNTKSTQFDNDSKTVVTRAKAVTDLEIPIKNATDKVTIADNELTTATKNLTKLKNEGSLLAREEPTKTKALEERRAKEVTEVYNAEKAVEAAKQNLEYVKNVALAAATARVKEYAEDLKTKIGQTVDVYELPELTVDTRKRLIGCFLYTAGDVMKAVTWTAKNKTEELDHLQKMTGISKANASALLEWLKNVGVPVRYSYHPPIDPENLVFVNTLSGVDKKTVEILFKNSMHTVQDVYKAIWSKDGKAAEIKTLVTITGLDQKDAENIVNQVHGIWYPPEFSERYGFVLFSIFDVLSGVDVLPGINRAMEDRFSRSSIFTVANLQKATKTFAGRDEVALITGIPIEEIRYYAVQADLLSIPDMTPEDADKFIEAGLYPACDLRMLMETGPGELFRLYPEIPTLALCLCSKQSKFIDTGFETIPPGEPTPKHSETDSSNFYIGLPEVIKQLGMGIGKAQRELDRRSIETQNSILRDNEMAEYGINATWYAMPEINFDLRMEYTVREEKSEDGTKTTRTIDLIPSNAKYRNSFESTKIEESILSIKFRPIPPPAAFVERREVPDLIGMTRQEAEEELLRTNIKMKIDDKTEPNIDDEMTSVTYQSLEPGCFMLANEILSIRVESRTV